MEHDKGPVATEAPPITTVSPVSQAQIESLAADAASRAQSLKRPRETTPISPESGATVNPNHALSPSKAARLVGLTSRHSPAPMTGAAAIESERRRKEEEYKQQVAGNSENPAYKVQSELMAADSAAVSRPQDAPSANDAQPEDASENAPPVSTPTPTTVAPAAPVQSDKSDQTIQSAENIATVENGSAPVTNSPTSMDIDSRSEREGFDSQPSAQMEDKGPTATSLSYPGMLQPPSSMPAPAIPARGMSMPMTPNQAPNPKSPGSKKHKCPYCETEFTRHHNLKSHLLTHSQEKPYVCQNSACSQRFRRLHDLKRHSKLHTGEKPHVCPKCERKFARGDALARHTKGPGGCVGRRSSMGGAFLGEDLEGPSQMDGDSTMTDVVYDGGNDVDMTEHDRRRLSMSGMKAPQGQGSNISLPITGGNPYGQTGITESPKPLSPGAQARDRSSSGAQFSQQNFGRQQSDQNEQVSDFSVADAARYAAQVAGHINAATSQAGHDGAQNGGSGDSSTNNMFTTDQGVWAYIHNLEESVRHLQERMESFEETTREQNEKIALLTNALSNVAPQPQQGLTQPEPTRPASKGLESIDGAPADHTQQLGQDEHAQQSEQILSDQQPEHIVPDSQREQTGHGQQPEAEQVVQVEQPEQPQPTDLVT